MQDSDKRNPRATGEPAREDAAADAAAPADVPPDQADDEERVVRPGVWSPPPQAEAAGPDAADPGADQADPQAASEGEDRVERISRLEDEKSDLTDRLLRTVADMENLRKRTQRDLDDTRRYAVTRFAGDVLAVADNLQRALGAASADWLAGADETTKSVLDGVEVTAREFERVLEKHGVKRIPAKGERFDPHRHQAMFEVANPDVPAGTVIEEVQPGYMIGERVLRAAMVGVARGGPKPGDADKTSEASEDITDGTAEGSGSGDASSDA